MSDVLAQRARYPSVDGVRLGHGWSLVLTFAWLAATYWLLGPVAVHTDRRHETQPMQLTTAEEFCRANELNRQAVPWVKGLCLSPQINLESSN